jgi:putative ABC transport system substrate-binding protein
MRLVHELAIPTETDTIKRAAVSSALYPMTTRRQALRQLALLASASGLPLASGAGVPKRIGILSEASPEPAKDTLIWEPRVWELMAQRGWVVGENVAVERAFAETKSDRLPRLAEELVRKRVDVILCLGDQEAMSAAARATQTIPILVFEVFDPVEQGLVESLARPGRNVTGISLVRGPDLAMKRLQYLRTIAPSAKRLCWLWGRDTSMVTRVDGSRYDVAASLATAAQSLEFETRTYHVTGASDIDKALADAVVWRAQALTTSGFPLFLARQEVAQFALRQRWPSAFAVGEFVQAGGLLSFAVADSEIQLMTRRWIEYIDRVLRGAKPADMPVIAADRYDLQINMKTAETLGLTIPKSILSRADTLVR